MQPPLPSQLSAVQALLSSHEYGVPLHTPSTQLSFLVQAIPSSQERLPLQNAPFAVAALTMSAPSLPLPVRPASPSPDAELHAATAMRAHEKTRKIVGQSRAWDVVRATCSSLMDHLCANPATR
jgi:hypothetical protein